MADSNTVLRREGPMQDPSSSAKAILIADSNYREGGLIRNCLKVRNFEVVTFSTNIGAKAMDGLLEDLRNRKVPPKVILIADEDEGDAASRCFLRTVVVVNRPFKVGEVADIVEHLIGAP